jgi:hypothetical protein
MSDDINPEYANQKVCDALDEFKIQRVITIYEAEEAIRMISEKRAIYNEHIISKILAFFSLMFNSVSISIGVLKLGLVVYGVYHTFKITGKSCGLSDEDIYEEFLNT